MTRKEFIEKAREVHGNEYDYKSVPDINLENYSTIPITCEKHGMFYDTVYQNEHHTYRSQKISKNMVIS